MVGRAVTLVCQPSEPRHIAEAPDAPARYREYLASIPGPNIVVVQDLDKPNFIGTYFGEVECEPASRPGLRRHYHRRRRA